MFMLLLLLSPVSLKYCRKISFSVCGAENIDMEKAIERKMKINSETDERKGWCVWLRDIQFLNG